MKCEWQALLQLLPPDIRNQITYTDMEALQDIRLRIHQPPVLLRSNGTLLLKGNVSEKDLQFVINTACSYSPWTAASVKDGFLTARGGHRIGICGNVIANCGKVHNITHIHSLCVRVAKDVPNCARELRNIRGSILIIGSPGTGKTTLLRDLIRQKSKISKSALCVVDEREELFPFVDNLPAFFAGENTDILTGCNKAEGVLMLLRTMGPDMIAVDEITHPNDCESIEKAAWCGVDVLATAHARDATDFYARSVYQPLVKMGIFQTLVILDENKHWHTERLQNVH